MPDVFDAIRERRSIRKYQQKPVPQEIVEEILSAAQWAPSAHNAQPWRFIVLGESSVKRELAEAMAQSWAVDMVKEGAVIDAEMLRVRVERFVTAPVLILACLTMDCMNKFPDEKRQKIERDLAMQSFGASLENMLLATYSKGLGACWFCAPGFCKETVRKALKIPDEIEPQVLVAIGYPTEKPTAPPRKLLGEYCFKDKWGSKL
jgi:F420 biosynthesis protein FbiB-like protein